MWDLPRPGLEPMSPALAGGFLSTAPPEKPSLNFKYDWLKCLGQNLMEIRSLTQHFCGLFMWAGHLHLLEPDMYCFCVIHAYIQTWDSVISSFSALALGQVLHCNANDFHVNISKFFHPFSHFVTGIFSLALHQLPGHYISALSPGYLTRNLNDKIFIFLNDYLFILVCPPEEETPWRS